MKRVLFAVALSAAAIPAMAADVGVSISVGQPGFYGQIDLGTAAARPQVVYAQPVVVERPVIGFVQRDPVYLYVPPGHQKHWKKYCHDYDACGRPVYFVRESWYNNVYVPRYRERHGGGDRHYDGGGRGGRGGDGGGWNGRGGDGGGRGGDWGGGGHGGGHGHGRD